MNTEAPPPDWRMKSLAQIGRVEVAKLNPMSCPDETFEYYSIPAYQNDASPDFTKGSEILSHKLLIPARCVLFGKLNPRVQKVWNVRAGVERRRLASTEWLTLVPVPEVDQDFLYFLMYSDWVMPIAQTLVSGSTPSRQRVNEKAFFDIRVPVPSLREQQKIADILRLIHRSISVCRSAIAAGLTLRSEAMRYLFAQGLRGESTKNTMIGSIPRSWEAVSLGRLCDRGSIEITMGQSPPSSTYNESGSGLPFYQGSADFGPLQPTTRVWCVSARKFASAEETLLSVRAPVGDLNMAVERCGIGRGLAAVSAGDDVDPWFLYFVLLYRRSALERLGTGSTFASVSRTAINQLDIPFPTKAEQKEIASTLVAVEQRIETHRRKLTLLEQLFRTLLHDLMTGRIRAADLDLPEVESLVGTDDTRGRRR